MPHAPLVFIGGTVLTGHPKRPVATALAVDAGRVSALDTEARERIGRATEVVDLRGQTLVPGFRDGHIHPPVGRHGTARRSHRRRL
jgi:predicted amidohydrolase YtcJ